MKKHNVNIGLIAFHFCLLVIILLLIEINYLSTFIVHESIIKINLVVNELEHGSIVAKFDGTKRFQRIS